MVVAVHFVVLVGKMRGGVINESVDGKIGRLDLSVKYIRFHQN